MRSQEIQDAVVAVAGKRDFTAPYGIVTGTHTDSKGKKYLSVTFGRARTLDAEVKIYNRNFMLVRTNQHGTQTFRDVAALIAFIKTL